MPAERFFFNTPFNLHSFISIDGEEFHHMIKVMRNQVGDSIELVNGLNQLACGKISSISKKEASIYIENVTSAIPNSSCILAQAMMRISKIEWIIEKAVELNVKEIRLFPSINSEKVELKENQLMRLQTLSQAALKQCGRLDLPSITLAPPIEKWSRESFPCFYGDTDPNAPALNVHSEGLRSNQTSLIVIGPEKGLHPKEIEMLRNLHFHGVSLASNTLRAETAAMSACAVIDYLKNVS